MSEQLKGSPEPDIEESDTPEIELIEEKGCDKEGGGKEVCDSCGEVHDEKTITLSEAIKKQKRWYHAAVVVYIIALGATTFCFYKLLGTWGSATFVAGFCVHFIHMNMNAMVRLLVSLEQVGERFDGVDMQSMIESIGQRLPESDEKANKDNTEGTGQYI